MQNALRTSTRAQIVHKYSGACSFCALALCMCAAKIAMVDSQLLAAWAAAALPDLFANTNVYYCLWRTSKDVNVWGWLCRVGASSCVVVVRGRASSTGEKLVQLAALSSSCFLYVSWLNTHYVSLRVGVLRGLKSIQPIARLVRNDPTWL